ncbi:hypothetical protein WA1_43110 [Scytonema hofmannii PCC 7110]|uniref:Uncharacterized protein n=1 Tax=Scytonema hofmannii PCC 7110 TaxID=128403 RepID=A0A139WVN2_9CYAN|nr:hypothetical protein [Scytonema hofmannii]KYC36488.1 hypothetical protein WA1_43110 [Scytonema hofmannii PCC 7110]
MFLLLSRVLLWLLVGAIIYSLFQKFYPQGNFVARLFLVILFVVVLLSFINPNEPAVASLWRVVSFPLKPLGASILLMILAAQKMKDGALGKPGGYLLGWALVILLLASTPAVAYFLVRSPVAAMVVDPSITSQLVFQNGGLTASMADPKYETLIASAYGSPTVGVSDVGDPIVARAPYLMQTPAQTTRRGLRLEDFVPNAETLSITSRVWETYLNYISGFLRGGR